MYAVKAERLFCIQGLLFICLRNPPYLHLAVKDHAPRARGPMRIALAVTRLVALDLRPPLVT